jgi:multicomponent Na+:H+ antiporter subunit F
MRWAREIAMDDFLMGIAGFLLAITALGLLRILRGPNDADRMMAAQLLGSGAVAILLLVSRATAMPAALDVAILIALLAAFASVAFVKGAPSTEAGEDP